MAVTLDELTSYLDDYLRVHEVGDSPNALNGLQVANEGTIRSVAAAVDVCQVTIEQATAVEADLLLVHHGLFWGGLQPLVGRHGQRVRTLMQHNLALYAAHLPLDLHQEVGNNAVLARALGLEDWTWFGEYHGQPIGLAGTLCLSRDELVERVQRYLGVLPHVIATGPESVMRVGIITGGGGSLIGQAVAAGVDTFVSGEGAHHTYFDAEESAINVIYAGHYATETVGVKALAAHVAQRFGVRWTFLDHPTGL
jgi:dinuclear metal center YbgI/SA1388 family protein